MADDFVPTLTFTGLRILKLFLDDAGATHLYGYSISKQLSIDVNTVYVALHRFKKAEWLETYSVPEEQDENEVPRKMYRLTNLGLTRARGSLMLLQVASMGDALAVSRQRPAAAHL